MTINRVRTYRITTEVVPILPDYIPVSDSVDRVLAEQSFYIKVGAFNSVVPEWHRHKGLELVLLHQGTANVFYGDWREQLTPGQGAIGPAHIAHGSEGLFHRTVIHFHHDLVPRSSWHLVTQIQESAAGSSFTLDPAAFQRIIWATQQLAQLEDDKYVPVRQSLMGLILTEVEVALANPQASDSPLLFKIIEFMKSNIKEDMTLDQLADHFGMSRTYMWHLFSNHLKLSPAEYWFRLRMEYACDLLAEGNASIADIASNVGFHSTSGFQRAFRRTYGMSPSDYRYRTRHSL